MAEYDFMDKRNILDLEDSFSFCCNGCGECCRNRNDIILSAYDIYRLSQGLNISDMQLLKEYCEIYIGKVSKLPFVKVVFENGVCKFMKDNKCSIHVFKPSVCKLYPLGRGVKEDFNEVFYFKQDTQCGGKGMQIVKEWVKGIDEEIFIVWSTFMLDLVKSSHYEVLVDRVLKNHKKLDIDYAFFYAIIDILYLQYDVKVDFLSQLKERNKRLVSALHSNKLKF